MFESPPIRARRFTVRVSESELAWLDELAAERGVERSEMVRHALAILAVHAAPNPFREGA